jgi:hypothetical protein
MTARVDAANIRAMVMRLFRRMFPDRAELIARRR